MGYLEFVGMVTRRSHFSNSSSNNPVSSRPNNKPIVESICFEYCTNSRGVIGFRIYINRELNRSVTANIYLTNILTSSLVLQDTLTWDDEGKNTKIITLTNSRLAHLDSLNEVDITIEMVSGFGAFKGQFYERSIFIDIIFNNVNQG